MTLAWFRQPGGDDPGSLNLAYNAVDLPVIRGLAGEPAVLGEQPLDFAGLLEIVGAVAGAFRGLGLGPGQQIGVALDDPHTDLIVFLAAARLGAIYADLPRASAPHLVVTDRQLDFTGGFTGDFTGHAPAGVVLVGVDPVDETRDLSWEIAVKAGRTDPAGCEPVTPGTTAYVLDEAVPVTPEPADDRLGRMIATLAAGKPVDPATAG